MATARFDLHTHSTASDGALSPRELVALAAERGLSGLAITDHDTVDGIEQAQAMGSLIGVRCIGGVELSCTSTADPSVHILGYFVNPQDPALLQIVSELQLARVDRARAMAERVSAVSGIELTLDDVLAQADGHAPGRPHVARAMVAKGVIASELAAFSPEWIGSGGRAFAPLASVPVARAIATIHQAGGAAVFAHPGSSRGKAIKEASLREAAAAGLDGVEVDHPDHIDDVVRRCVELAAELDLVPTSGSDDHGNGVEGSRLGCRTVPLRIVQQLEERAARR